MPPLGALRNLLLFCLLALYAGVGCVLFRHEYAVVVASADSMSSHGNFDHFASAFLTLFVLTTTENYPAVMMPTLNSGNSQTHVTGPVFFISFLVLVVFVLLPLLLAVGNHCYRLSRHRYRCRHA